jgi:hypothetical protein
MLTPFHSGYATVTSPAGTREADTQTCLHCNKVWVVRSSQGQGDLGGWCRLCGGMICPACAGQPCFPFERRLQAMEDRARFLRQVGD